MYANKILVGIDGSPNSLVALRWAIDHAAAASAEVQAVHAFFVPVLAYSAPGFIPPEQLEAEHQAKTILDAALESIPSGDSVKVCLDVVEGYPPDVMAKQAEDPDVALVVTGARGHGKVEEVFLGSVSHSLTHRCHKPLVIVPKRWTSGDGRVVVGVNGSAGSIPALRWAADFARHREGSLEAVIVYRPGNDIGGGKERASALVSDAITQIDTSGITVTTAAIDGHPAEVLLTQATNADLLVVGTRGLGRWREALTGSVAHACAEHSPVPVAVIRDYPLH